MDIFGHVLVLALLGRAGARADARALSRCCRRGARWMMLPSAARRLLSDAQEPSMPACSPPNLLARLLLHPSTMTIALGGQLVANCDAFISRWDGDYCRVGAISSVRCIPFLLGGRPAGRALCVSKQRDAMEHHECRAGHPAVEMPSRTKVDGWQSLLPWLAAPRTRTRASRPIRPSGTTPRPPGGVDAEHGFRTHHQRHPAKRNDTKRKPPLPATNRCPASRAARSTNRAKQLTGSPTPTHHLHDHDHDHDHLLDRLVQCLVRTCAIGWKIRSKSAHLTSATLS